LKWKKSSLKWKPRKKKSGRKSLVEKLDEITSLIVRARDGGCVQRGDGKCKGARTNGHVLPGRYMVLRWDIREDGNCHEQCWGHNFKHTYHQSDYYDWYIQKFGYERFQQLRKEYYGAQGKKFSDKELKELYEQLKKVYESYK
jgi:hypothetical protein